MISIKTGCAEKNRPESDVSIRQCWQQLLVTFRQDLTNLKLVMLYVLQKTCFHQDAQLS